MSITAELLTKATGFDERRFAQREAINVRAGFRKSGYDSAKADITDISTTGCKIDSTVNLGTNTMVWIKFPGFAPMEATVVWANGFEAGCEFSAGFYEPVLDNFLRRYQAA